MTLRLAINGYGRIGRSVLRALVERDLMGELRIVAVNEPADLDTIVYLTRYDSTHGRFPANVSAERQALCIGDWPVAVSHSENLADLPWGQHDIDVVLECSGAFSDRQTAEQHLTAGAKRVLFSQPGSTNVDATLVYGVNQHCLNGGHRVVSAASCTTNCVAPVISALHKALEIEAGVITTIHSAMNDQPVLDSYHHTDLRKTRGAIQSIIPVDTELAKGIDRVLPELAGRFEAQAMRVPTQNVSAIDLSIQVTQDTNEDEVNRILHRAAIDGLKGVLAFTEEPLASCDFNHDAHSGTVDASQTRVAGKRLVKVLIWFDNEWGYANRMVDILKYWRPMIMD